MLCACVYILRVSVYILVFVIRHACRYFSAQQCSAVCALSGSAMFSQTLSQTAQFAGKKLLQVKRLF
jgi:hypothetical protein